MSLKYLDDYARELFEVLDSMMGELWSDERGRPLDAEDLLEALSHVEAEKTLENIYVDTSGENE